ncbi:MAG: hypothetical protein WBM03_03710 [Steroidobacteraceae bacterium]
MTTRIVTAHLRQELAEERQRETLAALAEVYSGRVVEHAEVEAWAAGLCVDHGDSRVGAHAG